MNLITRDITANGRKFKFTTDEEHLPWYPDVCEIWALRFCEDNKICGITPTKIPVDYPSVALDIGAHHGLYSLVMSSWFDVIVPVESDHLSFMFLSTNMAQNGVSDVCQPVNARVGVDASLTSLTIPDKVGFVKMDVEGEEEAVLSGSGNLFQGQANFYIELHPNVVSDYSFLWKYINRDAYQIWERGNEIFGKRL